MSYDNAFFRQSDPRAASIAGFTLPDGWWSRPYEYQWALDHKRPGWVADMGAGGYYRPLRDALAESAQVYAVDIDTKLLAQPFVARVYPIIADFTKRIDAIDDGEMDAVYCISVLEDLGEKIPLALAEFRRVLKPGGLMYITLDIPFDDGKPCPRYPGIPLETFADYVLSAHLDFYGPFDSRKHDDIIRHDEFNLSVFHCVLTYDQDR